MAEDKEMMALMAIRDGKTMGRFLRELPGSKKMSVAQLQEYATAYKAVRSASVIPVELSEETFERGPLPKIIKGRKIRTK